MRFTLIQILRLTLIVLFAFLFTFSFSFSANAQESDEPAAKVQVPDAAMRQVVNRVLKWYFKPPRDKKTIYLASDAVKEDWLPKIENIEFRLLSNDKFRELRRVAYFFTETQAKDGSYHLGFAKGDSCSYTGDFWHFRIVRGKVHLWENGSVGGGCSDAA